MRPVLIPSGLCRTRFCEEEIAVLRPVPLLLAILLLGSAIPVHAQTALNAFDECNGAADTSGTYESDAFSSNICRHAIPTGVTSDPRGYSGDRLTGSAPPSGIIELGKSCQQENCAAGFDTQSNPSPFDLPHLDLPRPASPDSSAENSKASSPVLVRRNERPDANLDIYYRNRLEFGLDVGWHPINIPFVYDFAVGDSYNMTPLKYTLVPIIASLRWHVTNVGWRSVFRGNMDFTFSGSITPIPRGPETHYYSFMFGIRRNFVYRNWKAVPFFEERGGAGMIDAKEPLGVLWAQGQNLTFTYNMGAGVRYNFNSKYSFSAGMNYMHISNAYLSEPAFKNYGINVYGPMFGMDVRLGKPHHHASQ